MTVHPLNHNNSNFASPLTMTCESSTPNPHKVLCASNIKSHSPLVLDLERSNYDTWRILFMNRYESYDAIEHIDET